ncbi:hypothetical protein [Belnapia sp. F-4-1]|uniref:hypothetical protein n=1 Tax=Belnapia sp. F-4-1 TaxID=1545443 RepID=UPI001185759E|nr:hypothetical protein [Belnapia sp. F-4-1]
MTDRVALSGGMRSGKCTGGVPKRARHDAPALGAIPISWRHPAGACPANNKPEQMREPVRMDAAPDAKGYRRPSEVHQAGIHPAAAVFVLTERSAISMSRR